MMSVSRSSHLFITKLSGSVLTNLKPRTRATFTYKKKVERCKNDFSLLRCRHYMIEKQLIVVRNEVREAMKHGTFRRNVIILLP